METCRICNKEVSLWELLNNRAIVVNQKTYHNQCLMESTIKELEATNESVPRRPDLPWMW